MNTSPAISRTPRSDLVSALAPDSSKAYVAFLWELIANPRQVGAVVPSSQALAKRMAEMVGRVDEGYVIELGAGTGAVTSALLERCVPARRLIVIERGAALAEVLRKRFHGVVVLCGDAANLRRLLGRLPQFDQRHISHVVSSLPLRSLPPDKVSGILREVGKALRHGGRFVQYTYALASRGLVLPGFENRGSSVVWRNVPPARVDVFSHRAG